MRRSSEIKQYFGNSGFVRIPRKKKRFDVDVGCIKEEQVPVSARSVSVYITIDRSCCGEEEEYVTRSPTRYSARLLGDSLDKWLLVIIIALNRSKLNHPETWVSWQQLRL